MDALWLRVRKQALGSNPTCRAQSAHPLVSFPSCIMNCEVLFPAGKPPVFATFPTGKHLKPKVAAQVDIQPAVIVRFDLLHHQAIGNIYVRFGIGVVFLK